MFRLTLAAALAACTAFATAPPALAHGGGLDASGCHMNRKTGVRHCHGGGGPATTDTSPKSKEVGGAPFPNCTAARAAGAAPVRRGDPGYSPRLDRDGDGVGCEN